MDASIRTIVDAQAQAAESSGDNQINMAAYNIVHHMTPRLFANRIPFINDCK